MRTTLAFPIVVAVTLFGATTFASAQTQPAADGSAKTSTESTSKSTAAKSDKSPSNAMASMRHHRMHHRHHRMGPSMSSSRPGGQPVSRKPAD